LLSNSALILGTQVTSDLVRMPIESIGRLI